MIIGYIFPNRYGLAFALSILWELFERALVNIPVLYELTKRYWFVPDKYWNERVANRVLDLGFNMVGYAAGSWISHSAELKISNRH